MAPPPPPAAAAGLKAVNTKRYTLAALLATLAVAAIVTTFFVLLCPARITFSVAHTGSSHNSSGPAGGGGGSSVLSLTLAADNPSRRAKVTYESMFVDVSNSTAPGAQWDNWVRATVTTRMPRRQPGRTAAIDVTVPLVDAPWTQDFTGNMSSRFSVMVTAQARFRVGVAWTRLYDIKVSCSPVSFFTEKAIPGGAAAAAGGAAGLPVRCV
ncbi:unnamed protein product [Miscanthus lutarioriparius]|uniref:Late embryogenesis abundant protein LEA-2 subgroup domain-containing protein n=1 Tax=Miscanthus lutarioriparius TaxID=422564 RepID=A0A811SGD9_9POAL|nr:unnamed protein product [Miscanthus lutarioriparius]